MKTTRSHSLKRKIAKYFVVFALFVSVFFSGVAFFTLYVIEDAYFELRLQEEATYLQDVYSQTNHWPAPRVDYMALIQNRENFPKDIRDIAIEEPLRIEFTGTESRYYHVYPFHETKGPYLIAEVGNQLLVRAKRESLFWLLGIVSVFMTITAIFIGLRVSNRAVKPLTELTNQVANTSPENLDDKFAPNYPDNEIGQLAQRLDEARFRIAQFIQREQHFTRDASHELRTPIAIIKSSTELLMSQPETLNHSQKEWIQRIQSASVQMEQTITTLLALAREEHAANEAKTSLLPIIEKVVVQQSPLLDHKEVVVEINVPHQEAWCIEYSFIHILFTNLIGNAFQYTHKGFVKIDMDSGALRIIDSGTGFAPEVKHSATEALVKGHESKGYGIGLSLVARLCEHLNIELTISHLEKGTEVKLKPENQ